MSEALQISPQLTLPGLDRGISSPESPGGVSHFDSQEYPITQTSGLVRVLASRCPNPADVSDSTTNDICGQHGSHSYVSSILQRSLENRLKAILGSHGSTSYSVTWSQLDTPARRQICALRARGADHVRSRIFFVAHAVRAGLEGSLENRTSLRVVPNPPPAIGGYKSMAAWLPVHPDSVPVESIDGFPRPVGVVRAFGNAIVPALAAAFIRAAMEGVEQ